MKKLLIYSIVSFILFFSVLLLATNKPQQTNANQIIKHYYFVTEVHTTYIVTQSAKNYNEYLNFYYSDQVKPEPFKVGDKVAAYFQSDKGKLKIVDFKKVNLSPDEQTFKITKIENGLIYCTSNGIQSTLSMDYTKGLSLSPGDAIKVYFPHVDNGFYGISKVEKIPLN